MLGCVTILTYPIIMAVESIAIRPECVFCPLLGVIENGLGQAASTEQNNCYQDQDSVS
jgi:hypothetical protein